MRTVFYLFSLTALIGFATWTYKVNYATRDAERRVARLETAIKSEEEKIEVLKSEWAYLNRPERLLKLAEANFDVLRLGPIHSDHYADAAQVAFPSEELEGVILNTTATAAETPIAQ